MLTFNNYGEYTMKVKHFVTILSASCFIAGSVWAETPKITMVFSDPHNLCSKEGKTAFSFNYKYLADGGAEYYSGPIFVTQSPAIIQTSLDNSAHYFADFEITDQGPCGDMDLDYQNLGDCYLQNLIPEPDRQSPYSYQIVLTPQATGNSTYGTPMYNLTCKVITSS
jgi:hypothetical protein